ncbi:G-protein coupled estrogen receptor 1-like [Heterodontus francisci]|uniref:G-protein coupled estrogen receptor 1-like n=1 Tax=Heterodontus francisci TaxID=7792 RepID=UPI00355C7B78
MAGEIEVPLAVRFTSMKGQLESLKIQLTVILCRPSHFTSGKRIKVTGEVVGGGQESGSLKRPATSVSVKELVILDWKQSRCIHSPELPVSSTIQPQPECLQGSILGDRSYSLKTWLMTMVRNPRNEAEECYNESHVTTRVITEQIIDLLKMRFSRGREGLDDEDVVQHKESSDEEGERVEEEKEGAQPPERQGEGVGVSAGALPLTLTRSSGCRQRERIDQSLRTIDWNITAMVQNLTTIDWNVRTLGRSLSWTVDYLSANYDTLSLERRIYCALLIIQYIYYPILAFIGVPANLLTIVIMSRGKCGLSKCVTRYLVAMAMADLLVVILDLILRHIPIVFREHFHFLWSIRMCNIHAVLLFAATDCSVWFTVTFTFDRFVAICCQKLKTKYCTEKTAAVVLGTVTVLSCLKNIFWYFMFTDQYWMWNAPWFCPRTFHGMFSLVWGAIEFLHYILTPGVPFVVIMLLNAFTIRHILVSRRGRRRLQTHSTGDSRRDPEMESRRKSIILLLFISANFILLWALLTAFLIWWRIRVLTKSSYLIGAVMEAGYMLQLLSCCTNTGIYAVTQTKFREQLRNVLKKPFTPIVTFIQ